MNPGKRILVVGGVAGGASCAARARRLSEDAEIVLFDRGPFVTFADCEIPYCVGNVISDEGELQLVSAELFQKCFNIEVRTENEVTAIDRERQEVVVKRLKNGEFYREKYDALVLALGAAPTRPPLPGVDLPGIFLLRKLPESRRIGDWIIERRAERAVIAGAGLVGLGMAENLAGRGLTVMIVEMLNQVLPALDPEMAEPVLEHLVAQGLTVHLGDAVTAFEEEPGGTLAVRTRSGASFPADLVILSLGHRPEVKLAKDAGLEIGDAGGIRVDDGMRTSDPDIWAVGEAVETRDFVTGEWCLVPPAAGLANRQGRIAADSICGRETAFRGIQATRVIDIFGLTAAVTGATEKTLKRAGITDYQKIYLQPGQHGSHHACVRPICMKLLFSTDDGRILGAQAVGEESVKGPIDVIATLIQMCGTVFDLEEAELCYAAKDPASMAGMIASNLLQCDFFSEYDLPLA
jgi:NADPH-dependent 2,4-dienoyl-CoA reductase/sulfur reductase-like enzyme